MVKEHTLPPYTTDDVLAIQDAAKLELVNSWQRYDAQAEPFDLAGSVRALWSACVLAVCYWDGNARYKLELSASECESYSALFDPINCEIVDANSPAALAAEIAKHGTTVTGVTKID